MECNIEALFNQISSYLILHKYPMKDLALFHITDMEINRKSNLTETKFLFISFFFYFRFSKCTIYSCKILFNLKYYKLTIKEGILKRNVK